MKTLRFIATLVLLVLLIVPLGIAFALVSFIGIWMSKGLPLERIWEDSDHASPVEQRVEFLGPAVLGD